MVAINKIKNILVILPVSISITGCTVTEYEKPVNDFAAATVNAETALVGLNKQITTAYSELQAKQVINRDMQTRYYKYYEQGEWKQDCLTELERCRLELLDSEGHSKGKFPQDAALRNMIVLMTAIRMYAQNLAAIINADTSAKVSASVNSTLGSVSSLANSVEKVGGQKNPVDLSEYKTPVGDIINWFVGNYIAAVKFDGLRRATAAADPVIVQASKVMEGAAGAGADVPRASLAEATSMRNDAFADDRNPANLQKLITDAAAFDQFLLAKPSGVFVRMADAHQALTRHLQSEAPSMAVVANKIKEFLVETETLRRVIEELRSAANEKGK